MAGSDKELEGILNWMKDDFAKHDQRGEVGPENDNENDEDDQDENELLVSQRDVQDIM